MNEAEMTINDRLIRIAHLESSKLDKAFKINVEYIAQKKDPRERKQD